jgi:hypothetical protein
MSVDGCLETEQTNVGGTLTKPIVVELIISANVKAEKYARLARIKSRITRSMDVLITSPILRLGFFNSPPTNAS